MSFFNKNKKEQKKKIWIIIILIGIVILFFWLCLLGYQFSRIKSDSGGGLFGKYKEELKQSFDDFKTNLGALKDLGEEQELTDEQLREIEARIKQEAANYE